MEMGMSICRKESEDEQMMRKGKRKKVDWFVFLTDDILLDILKRLPDALLCYKAKYVCRRWLDLISNRILLDRASFILQKASNFTARHVRIREEGQGLQEKVQDLDIPLKGMIESWGNDYLLISDYKEGKRRMYVYNQITKEGSYLPKCKNASCGGSCTSDCGVAVSFNGFKGIYKVVHLFMGPPIECHILILRRDIVSSKWRKIQVPCINGERALSGLPVSVQGRYIHWDVRSDKRVFSIDMVKEEIADISLPLPDNDCYTIFEMGGALAFCTENTRDKADIWILKDFQRNKWEKLQSVTLEKWYDKRFPVCGVTVMSSNKYIILECKHEKGMCYYDMKSGHVKKLAITIDFDEGCMFHSSPSF